MGPGAGHEADTVLSPIQKAEIRALARQVLWLEQWDALPWEDAWRGVYPARPNDAEIAREARRLEQTLARIAARGDPGQEFADTQSHRRMILLASARTFDVYRFRADPESPRG